MSVRGTAVRHHLFTLIALLGCVVPFVTPRHFPVHQLPGTEEPPVMPWVTPARAPAADVVTSDDQDDHPKPRQLGGQANKDAR